MTTNPKDTQADEREAFQQIVAILENVKNVDDIANARLIAHNAMQDIDEAAPAHPNGAEAVYAKPHNQQLSAEPYAEPDKAEVLELFKAWVLDVPGFGSFGIEQRKNGDFDSSHTQLMWLAYQAALQPAADKEGV